MGAPVVIPPDLAQRADEVGPIAIANNLAWRLVEQGREACVIKEGPTSEVETKIDGILYVIQIKGLLGSFNNWIFRIEAGKNIAISDPKAWPQLSDSDKTALSLAENAGSLPLSPIPGNISQISPMEEEQPPPAAFFEMPVDDVFSVSGKGTAVKEGTIVVGIVKRGYLSKNDRVFLVLESGARLEATCMGIQTNGKLIDTAETGANVGLMISGLTRDQISPGDIVISEAARPASAHSYREAMESRSATGLDGEILAFLYAGKPVQAIKLRREKTGEDLKKAHDVVDNLARSHGFPPLPLQLEKSSRCLIATAACGANSPDVLELRYYRDTVMCATTAGRIAIWLYDVFSPPLAFFIALSPAARSIVRRFLVLPLARVVRKRIANKPM
jgi:hypothetical protein